MTKCDFDGGKLLANHSQHKHYWRKRHTHQIIKYVPLVDMDSDEGLILGPLYRLQIFSGHVNQGIKHIQKVLVSFGHDASIVPGIGQSFLWVTSPYDLNA